MDREGESVDIEALVAEVETEAAELRERLGGIDVRTDETLAARHEPGTGNGDPPARRPLLLRDLADSLERLRGQADPRSAPISSHRGVLAAPVLAAKRLLIRLLTPIWDQQTTFNRALVDQLGEIGEAVDSTRTRMDDRLTAVERRLLALEDQIARSGVAPGPSEPAFDYERFEAAFRGDPTTVREKLRPYLAYFDEGPVLDLGCGDGAFLSLLSEKGVQARGVDQSGPAIERARAAGLDASRADLVEALEASGDGSLGGVVSVQVFEHLTLPVVLQVLQMAKRKLRPGGILLVETVNLASLVTFSRAWTIDPTHRQALHPLTLRFLVEEAGFSHVELLYSGDVEPEHRIEASSDDPVQVRNAAILNELVFGPQDYAVIGRA